MYLVDTNIVSLLDPRRRSDAATRVLDWMRLHDAALHLSAITILEIEEGRLKLLRRRQPERAAQIGAVLDVILAAFAHRILPVDVRVALAAAAITDALRRETLEGKDVLIAATARVHGFTVLTANLIHFERTGVPVIKPLDGLPPESL